jgi:hypothetical protein
LGTPAGDGLGAGGSTAGDGLATGVTFCNVWVYAVGFSAMFLAAEHYRSCSSSGHHLRKLCMNSCILFKS